MKKASFVATALILIALPSPAAAQSNYEARSELIFDHIASLTLAPDGDLLVIEPRIASVRLIDL